MRKSFDKINKAEREMILKTLYRSADKMVGDQAVRTFIDNVLTEGERIVIGRRLLIAQMTLAGMSQPEIGERLSGVSPNTFGRIYKWLDKEFPGYDDALKQSKKEEQARIEKRRKPHYEHVDPFSMEGLKRRYPLHFLLFNIVDYIGKK
ncbi:MAG: helix-turn-helix domain-containing protein [Candidatus Paceibacterota bacterium]